MKEVATGTISGNFETNDGLPRVELLAVADEAGSLEVVAVADHLAAVAPFFGFWSNSKSFSKPSLLIRSSWQLISTQESLKLTTNIGNASMSWVLSALEAT